MTSRAIAFRLEPETELAPEPGHKTAWIAPSTGTTQVRLISDRGIVVAVGYVAYHAARRADGLQYAVWIDGGQLELYCQVDAACEAFEIHLANIVGLDAWKRIDILRTYAHQGSKITLCWSGQPALVMDL